MQKIICQKKPVKQIGIPSHTRAVFTFDNVAIITLYFTKTLKGLIKCVNTLVHFENNIVYQHVV